MFARVLVPRGNPRKLAALALALGLAAAASGCGGSGKRVAATKRVGGDGYAFRAPRDWQIRHRARTVEARSGSGLVSVTVFSLPRPFSPAQWRRATGELDRVARQLAVSERASLTSSATGTIAGLRARIYELDHDGRPERIGFVLRGRREYELFCRDAGGACDTLFASFSLAA